MDTDDQDDIDLADIAHAMDQGVTWVRFIEAGRELATCPMPGVPRVGDFVNLGDPLIAPMQLHRVVAVVWQHPGQASEDPKEQGSYLVGLRLRDLPPVLVHVESGTKK